MVALAVALVALVASPARPDAKQDATILALQQSAVAAGRRTVTAVAEGTATRKADKFAVAILVNSGNGPAATQGERLAAIEERMATLLREARLPTPGDHSDGTPAVTGSTPKGQTSYVDRTYTMPVASYDAFRAVDDALKPITFESNVINEEAKVRSVQFRATSSALDADRKAVELEARQQALANGKKEATEHAAAVGMKLGPPMLIGPLSVRDHGIGHALEQGYAASGIVVFELVE